MDASPVESKATGQIDIQKVAEQFRYEHFWALRNITGPGFQHLIENLLTQILSSHPNVAGADQVTKERAALVKLAEALTCRGDDTHYCPNCDNSLFNAKQIVDNALASPPCFRIALKKRKRINERNPTHE